MAYTAEIVETARDEDGQVVVTAGKVDGIDSTDAGTLVLSVSGPAGQQHVEADLVISNFGRESNYERVDSPLWANLLRKGIAFAHRRTGRGVEVDGCGTLVGPSGLPSGPISAVGSPREGDEIVRNGRTGAFTFNLAAIKNHSVEVATSVMCQLESCYDSAAATLSDTPDPGLTEAVSYSTMIEVRRMTARRRDYRQAFASCLEESLQTIQAITTRNGKAMTDRAVRAAITKAASAKLKDLSVTPRDLRTLLCLEDRLEPVD
jgi:hypothetical protein